MIPRDWRTRYAAMLEAQRRGDDFAAYVLAELLTRSAALEGKPFGMTAAQLVNAGEISRRAFARLQNAHEPATIPLPAKEAP